MKLNTVNVIEVVDDNIVSVSSFSDDEAGNKEAEELFKKIIQENANGSMLYCNIQEAIEDGRYSLNGFDGVNYFVSICHS